MRPGAVFADLAAAVADGADCIDGVGQRCGDREHVFGPAASTTTMWRLVDSRVDAAHLPGIRAARTHARAAAWAAGAAPAAGEWLHLDVDATITIDHSDNKENAAATWKKTWGHHSLLVFLDRPEIAGGEALAGLLRPGNAGAIPPPTTSRCWSRHWNRCRWLTGPTPDDPGAPQILVRSDSAGATHDVRRGVPRGRGGILLRLPRRRPGAATRWKSSTPTTAGIRRSTPTATSVTAPGSPKPPGWST